MANQEKNCYIIINGKKLGPASEADIQKLYDHKKITGDTKFARVGDAEWITVSEVGIFTPPLPEGDRLPPLPSENKPIQTNEQVKVTAKKSNFGFIIAGLGVAVVASIVVMVGIFGNAGNNSNASES